MRQRSGILQVDWSIGVRATIRASFTTPESSRRCQRPSRSSESWNPDCSPHTFRDSELLEIDMTAESPRKELRTVEHNSWGRRNNGTITLQSSQRILRAPIAAAFICSVHVSSESTVLGDWRSFSASTNRTGSPCGDAERVDATGGTSPRRTASTTAEDVRICCTTPSTHAREPARLDVSRPEVAPGRIWTLVRKVPADALGVPCERARKNSRAENVSASTSLIPVSFTQSSAAHERTD